jgi:hypothetical protein
MDDCCPTLDCHLAKLTRFHEWHSVSWLRAGLRPLKEERGSVESALVLIPLLALFLIGMQISLGIHGRNMGQMEAQNSASVRAISGEFEDSDNFIHIESSGDDQNLDLLVTRNEFSLQNLLPGFLVGSPSDKRIDVGGIAIVENSR